MSSKDDRYLTLVALNFLKNIELGHGDEDPRLAGGESTIATACVAGEIECTSADQVHPVFLLPSHVMHASHMVSLIVTSC